MSFENTSNFQRAGSIRSAVVRFRSSMRKKFSRSTFSTSRSRNNPDRRRNPKPIKPLEGRVTDEQDHEYETYYRGNVKDVARRFINISRHKAQESIVAAKVMLKIQKPDTPTVTSMDVDDEDDFFGGYRLSFSDNEEHDDVFLKKPRENRTEILQSNENYEEVPVF